VLHVFPVALEEVNVTVPPIQNVVGPLVATTGVLGNGFTTTAVLAEAEEHPDAPTVTE
jgi:hypothetical protein